MSFACQSYVLVYHLYVIRMSLACHSYVLVCHPYVTRMYSYVIRMSLVCTRMSSVCHSYVLVCHQYVTRMYSYVIRMSLVCGFTMNRFFIRYEISYRLEMKKNNYADLRFISLRVTSRVLCARFKPKWVWCYLHIITTPFLAYSWEFPFLKSTFIRYLYI